MFATQFLVAAMGEGGCMDRSGFFVKPEQRDFSQRWASMIAHGLDGRTKGDLRARLLMLGADTGTGKTIGFALPAMAFAAAYNLRVAIATRSHVLQRQMLGDESHPGDLRIVNQWLTEMGLRQLNVACRYGAQAFISAYAVNQVLLRLGQDDPIHYRSEIEKLEKLYLWALDGNAGDTSGLLEDARLILDDACFPVATSEICVGADSPETDLAAYRQHLKACADADVVLMTHHFLAATTLYREPVASTKFDLLVLDEADQLISAADTVFRDSLSLFRAQASVSTLGGHGEQASQHLKTLTDLCLRVGSSHSSRAAIPLSAVTASERHALFAAASLAARALGKLARSHRTTNEGLGIREMADTLGRFARTNEGDFFVSALSFSSTRHFPSLNMVPSNMGVLLRKLWRKTGDVDPPLAVLFTSATLAVPGRSSESLAQFKTSARLLGIPTQATEKEYVDPLIWAQFEPAKFGKACFILADPKIPGPINRGISSSDDGDGAELNPRWMKYLALMTKTAHVPGRRTLVLVNSYEEGAALAKELSSSLGLTPIVQAAGQGSMRSCQTAFVSHPDALWISPTAWEGLNLPGMISNLVVSRIPFSPIDKLDRMLLTERGILTHANVEAILFGHAMNKAKSKLRQGLGRPIRSATDRARLFIADPRFPLPKEVIDRLAGKLAFEPNTPYYTAFHAVVPSRFTAEFRQAAVLLEDGSLI